VPRAEEDKIGVHSYIHNYHRYLILKWILKRVGASMCMDSAGSGQDPVVVDTVMFP
jgi:hypothetical protein